LQSKLGVTALYVTHDQVEAMTMADRMIVMNEGVAEQIGTPLEVYQNPRTLFAAQFIGSPAMNIFDAKLANGNVTLGNGAVVPCELDYRGDVKIGIRPEHLIVDSAGPIELEVGFTEPLGANTLMHGRLKQTESALTASLIGVHQSQQSIINLAVVRENIHLFDVESGLNIEFLN